MLLKYAHFNKQEFFSRQRCICNVLLFTTTSKLLQKASIVNLLCVIKTETPFNTFSFHNFEGVENTYYLHNKIEFSLR